MNTKIVVAVAICLFFCLTPDVYGQKNYVPDLVKNLLEIGYPISKDDVVALDKISMRFNAKNRMDVLKKILSDRGTIHKIKNASYFEKTEAICNALRLLDELGFPEADALIKKLSSEGGWEKREKTLLAYMCAKRGMNYDLNVAFLLKALAQNSGTQATNSKVGMSVEILDFCNILTYLADIFDHTGDKHVLNELILFSMRGYGYPGEYTSRLLVDMLLQQPDIFVSVLSAKDEHTRKAVIDAMVFGIWNNQQRGDVIKVINDNLHPTDQREKDTVSHLTNEINRKFRESSTSSKDTHIDKNSKK